jgi:hypothetical protein
VLGFLLPELLLAESDMKLNPGAHGPAVGKADEDRSRPEADSPTGPSCTILGPRRSREKLFEERVHLSLGPRADEWPEEAISPQHFPGEDPVTREAAEIDG